MVKLCSSSSRKELTAVLRARDQIDLWDATTPRNPSLAQCFTAFTAKGSIEALKWLHGRLFATGNEGFLLELNLRNSFELGYFDLSAAAAAELSEGFVFWN